MTTTSKFNFRNLALSALLTAIIVLMGFTPIGFLKLGIVEITFISIPVTIGAIMLGKWYGTYFGAVFGLVSFIQCFGFSPFGATLLAINPIFTFILCMLPRMLMGLLVGVFYEIIDKFDKKKIASYAVASLCGPALNTLFFVPLFVLLFSSTDYVQNELMPFFGTANVFVFAVAFVGLNGLIEAIVCTFLNFTIAKSLRKFISKSE